MGKGGTSSPLGSIGFRVGRLPMPAMPRVPARPSLFRHWRKMHPDRIIAGLSLTLGAIAVILFYLFTYPELHECQRWADETGRTHWDC